MPNKRGYSFISRVNSDIVDNMFCQQRTLHNGTNTNPTYLGYCNKVNSVILGQASISRTFNVGGGDGAQLMTHKVPQQKQKVLYNTGYLQFPGPFFS